MVSIRPIGSHHVQEERLWTMTACVSQFNYNLDKWRLPFSGHFPHYHFFPLDPKNLHKIAHFKNLAVGRKKMESILGLGIREPVLYFLFGHLEVHDL